jgi:membrane-bound lytic murein transglycosylase A
MAARAVLTASIIAAAAFWIGPAHAAPGDEPFKFADAALEPVKWSAVPGWTADDHLAAFDAFMISCQPFLKIKGAMRDTRPVAIALNEICRKNASLKPKNAAAARAFFEENFRPVRITRLGEPEGFLTGYYEPIVQGSRFPQPEFPVPLYRRPRDLVLNGQAAGVFPNKGVQVGRRNAKGELVPYFDRAEIEAGALDGRNLEICYVRDFFEAITIQIQGSARVVLEDGTVVRVNYDSHNGYPYSSIGRVLIERNEIPRDEMSMQRIRDWMKVNPNKAADVRATNRSFVFFRITGLDTGGEPRGAQDVPLTPGRSIAVDKPHVYGTPFYIDAMLPIDTAKPTTLFRRLMIAQDTGSAIVGPARADLYWGAGDAAGKIAGRIRHPGRFVMLLPKALDLTEAGRHMPLPPAKPANIVEDGRREAEEAPAETKSDDGGAGGAKPAAETARETSKAAPKQAAPGKSRPGT